MAWMRETDYPPAAAHLGFPALVLRDGSEAIAVPPSEVSEVIGWKAACSCGWNGARFYPRGSHHTVDGQAPDEVDGHLDGSAAFGEWNGHLQRALPELDVYEFAKQLGAVQERFEEAVRHAQDAGVTRARIIEIAAMTGAQIAFRREGDLPTRPARSHRMPAPHQPPPSRPDGPTLGRS